MQITGNHVEGSDHKARLPLTDYNYHSSTALEGFSGPCAKTGEPAFYTLSRDYFKGEACNYFLAEAFVFTAIMLSIALPVLNGARAVFGLISAGSGI